jgi:hypothetical protein
LQKDATNVNRTANGVRSAHPSYIREKDADRHENRNENNSFPAATDKNIKEESFRAVAKGSFLRFSVASQVFWSREAAEVNFRSVRKDQASGIRFGATRPDAHVARYFLLVVFFFFLAAFFFAIMQSPPFLKYKCTLLKISRQRFFTKSSGKITGRFFERAL